MAYKRYKYDLCKTDHLHIQAESPGCGSIQCSKRDRKIRTSGHGPHHVGGDKRTKVACQVVAAEVRQASEHGYKQGTYGKHA